MPCSLVAAAIAVAPQPGGATRLPYANFAVTVSGTETTTVNGREECQDELGTVAPAKASEAAQFSTRRPRTLQFYKAGRSITVTTPRGSGQTAIVAIGSMTRQSDFVRNGSNPPVCPGGVASAGCGHADLSHISLLVQGGLDEVTLSANQLRPEPGDCLVPALAFPEMPETTTPESGSHVTYSAKVPRSLLDPRKRVVTIHGSGTVTSKSHEGSIIVDSATTTLNFTIRLRRVRLH
jgi:hypothetical protein